MSFFKALQISRAEDQTVNRMYWLSGCLAGFGCTMMTVSVVGLALL
jgi:hypothetical protein